MKSNRYRDVNPAAASEFGDQCASREVSHSHQQSRPHLSFVSGCESWLSQAFLRTSGKTSRLKSRRKPLVCRFALLVSSGWLMVLLAAWSMVYA